MSTTAIFAEVLLIGLLALGGLGVVAVAAVGLPTDVTNRLKDWTLLTTLAVTALAYPTGVSLDRLSDSLAERFEHLARPPDLAVGEPEMRFRVWEVSPARVVEFLDYARSRRRVTRSAALISGIVAFTATIVATVMRVVRHLNGSTEFVLALIGVFVFAVSTYAWWRIGVMYYARLQLAYRIHVLHLDKGAGQGLGG